MASNNSEKQRNEMMRVEIKKWWSENDTQFFHADSVGDLVKGADVAYEKNKDFIQERLGMFRNHCEGETRKGELMKDWFHCNGFNDAAKKATDGYQEGLELLESLIGEIGEIEIKGVQSIRRKRKFSDIDGDDICVDRLRSGQDFWQTTERVSMRGSKYIRLVFNLSAAANEKNERIYWRAVAAVVAAKILEEAGYRVEIVGVTASVDSYKHSRTVKNYVARVDVKQYDEPISDMNMAIVSAPFFLRAFVLTLGKDCTAIREFGSRKASHKPGLGGAVYETSHILEVSDLDNDHTIVIPDCFTRTEAVSAVRKIADQLSN